MMVLSVEISFKIKPNSVLGRCSCQSHRCQLLLLLPDSCKPCQVDAAVNVVGGRLVGVVVINVARVGQVCVGGPALPVVA